MQYVVIAIAALVVLYLAWKALTWLLGYVVLCIVGGVDWLGSGLAGLLGLGRVPAFNWAVVFGVAAASYIVIRELRKQARPALGFAFPLIVYGLLVGLALGVSGPSERPSYSTSQPSYTPQHPPSYQPPPAQRTPPPTPPPAASAPTTPCAIARDPARLEPLTRAGKSIDAKSPRPADTGNFETAVEQARMATTIDPTCAEAHSTLAYAQYRVAYGACGAKGSYGPAEASAQKALEIARDDKIRASALRNLGRIAAAKHRWDDALQFFKRSVEAGGPNSDSELWIADLETYKSMRPELLANLVRILKGEKLEESNLGSMTLREGTWLLNAGLARYGRQLNMAVEDWFFYCNDSPLAREMGGSMPMVDANAGRNPVKKGSVDWENTQLVAARRKALKSSGQPAVGDGSDPFDTASKPVKRGEATSAESPAGLQGAWSGPLPGGGQLKLIVEDVTGGTVQASATAMTGGEFETVKLQGALEGGKLVLKAPNGARLSARLKSGKTESLSGSWQGEDGKKLAWSGKKL
jgi:tetratricopeptide (TPR) repeat protein